MKFYQEYRNQHVARKYPFNDDASLRSIGGQALGTDVFVDAALYPLNTAEPLYLGSYNPVSNTVEVKSGDTVCASGTWNDGDSKVELYDLSGFKRHAGILVLGPGARMLKSETPMQFNADATTFVPACTIGINQRGVRGFVTGDGALTTGEVNLIGRNGVEITTYNDEEGRAVVRVDVYGTPSPEGKVIRAVKVENRSCPLIYAVVNEDDPNVIYCLPAGGFDASMLCTPDRIPTDEGELPGEADICEDDEHDPESGYLPIYRCPPDSDYLVEVEDGRIMVVAPGTLNQDNPLKIDNITMSGITPGLLRLQGLRNPDVVRRRIEYLWGAGMRERGLIKLRLRTGEA